MKVEHKLLFIFAHDGSHRSVLVRDADGHFHDPDFGFKNLPLTEELESF